MTLTSKTRRNLEGSFALRALAPGLWHLPNGDCAGAEIYLIGVEPDAGCTMRDTQAAGVALEWRAHGVLATMNSSGGQKSLNARAALVHEPLPQLYQSLPLAHFDTSARRFWRRVFWLVRIPGGRHLLRFMARSRRES